MADWLLLVGGSFAAGWLLGRLDRETRDDPRRRFNHENRRGPVGPPPLGTWRVGSNPPSPDRVPMPPGTPAPGHRRVYFDMPSTIAECGGPCTAGPKHCDCGALWVDVLK